MIRKFRRGDKVRIVDDNIKDEDWYKFFREECPQDAVTIDEEIVDGIYRIVESDFAFMYTWLEPVLVSVDDYKQEVKELTRRFIDDHVELSKYKEDDLYQMVEDIWFALFHDAVSEVARDALAEYDDSEDKSDEE